MIQFYLSCERVQAHPVEKGGDAGYELLHEGGRTTWCPKKFFEKHNIPLGTKDGEGGEKVLIEDYVCQEMIESVIVGEETIHRGKDLLLVTTLANGFQVTTVSTYSGLGEVTRESWLQGVEDARKKAHAQVQAYLVFLLYTAQNGLGLVQVPTT